MEKDAEDPTNSVHGKLMQEDPDVEVKGGNQEANSKKKKRSLFDFKIDIYIRRHGLNGESSAVKRYRTNMQRCVCITVSLLLFIVIIAVSVSLIIYFLREEPPIRKTAVGSIQGRLAQPPQGSPQVEEYLGIPFAQPPVGLLRYADPQPLDELPQDPYYATDYQSACIQILDNSYGDFIGTDMWNAKVPLNESCLYLNVWVPRPKKKNRAVMVWIYGGGFFAGSNSLWVYDGKALAAHTDVIVVSFNYRVGTFGFLSTGDGKIRGNFGLWDQVMALQWIQDNIGEFGGDPAQVTIFGESSGASSAGFLMMSNRSSHLFKRAIFQSGSPDSHWSFMTRQQARVRSRQFMQNVGCSYDHSTEEILNCLRDPTLSSREILNNEWVDGHFMVFPWAPTVDGAFLTDTPYNLLMRREIDKKDVMLGVNKDEGTFWILYALDTLKRDNISLHTRQQYAAGVDVIDWDLSQDERDRIRELYKPPDVASATAQGELYRDALDDVCGDRSFTCPTTQLANILAEMGSRTYFYHLTHRASNEAWPPWMGVIHGGEIQWVFGMSLNDSRGYSSAEKEFAKSIMSYWANFAKTGDPTVGNSGDRLPRWPEYSERGQAARHGSAAYDRRYQYLEMAGVPDNFVVRNGSLRKEPYCQYWWDINAKVNANGSAI